MQKLLKDPLIHFLVVGAALFVLLSAGDDSSDRERIVVPADEVGRLVQAAEAMRGRELSEPEIREIIEPVIRDEVYYREALALGLDENDDSVRTRLIEKMRYLTEDLAEPAPATEEELRAFFDANPRRFLIPEAVTFEQKFFSPSQRGEDLEDDVAAALARLRAGDAGEDIGDRTPLRERFESAPRDQVAVLFGESIAEVLFSLHSTAWQGPYESDFGLHLVRLIDRRAARQPAFEEVRDTVLEVFGDERRRQRNEAAYEAMRERYEILVDWPGETESTE